MIGFDVYGYTMIIALMIEWLEEIRRIGINFLVAYRIN
jgi:hypothetical protein